jgi:uncharacterized protein (DUF1800 family)
MSRLLFARLAPLFSLLALVGSASLSHAAQYNDRLINLSSRARAGTGDNALIAGFVIGSGSEKKVLIRAAGPSLAQFGLTGVLANPKLEVFDSRGLKVAENDDWSVFSGGPVATAADFAAAGAFGFSSPTSGDSAIMATLAPGGYTVKVSGDGAATGVALVEVYDVSGAAQLMNLSTRAQVQTGSQIVISGLVIAPGTAVRKVLVRAAGPALGEFGVQGVLTDPVVSLLNSNNAVIASNDNWGDGGRAPAVSAAATAAGAFSFSNFSSKDAGLLVDLAPGSYTLQVSGAGNSSGVALVEVYDLTPGSLHLVSVAATQPATDSSGGSPGVFTVTREGPTTQALTVTYDIQGTARNGVDYVALPGSVTIPAGASSATVTVNPYGNVQTFSSSKSVFLTLTSSLAYGVSPTNTAAVTIAYNPGTLYISNLRVPVTASSSAAYGTSSLQLSSDEKFALVGLSFSNLSAPQTLAYLRLGNLGDSGAAYLFQIPNGQASGLQWDIRDSGAYTASQIVSAIKEGRVFVSIETTAYPAGELQGSMVKSTGSMTFVAPLAPPAYTLGTPTSLEAARFLTQATFGPTDADISAVIAKGYDGWITEQMAKPASLHAPFVMTDFAAFNRGGQNNVNGVNTRPGQQHRLNAWWTHALYGEDQLRQRVAFALSQILVISDQNGTVNAWQEGAANFHDLLVKGAFGSFRKLLEDVSLNPMMGIYLSHLRNNRATGSALPDENYAREVMQLFSIGLNELNPDGTLRLDSQGLPIPTYNQTTISETAKVFTGWGYSQSYSTAPRFTNGAAQRPGNTYPDYLEPMRLFEANHEPGAKTIVGGRVLPANQGGVKDLADTLDALFHHPNTGPFISRQLIQRLVTSNPSPGYVYRVAQIFANNGSGARGDLGAVVRAILLDYEARTLQAAGNLTYGKLKEPLLRTSALFRAFKATSNTKRLPINNSNGQISQMAGSAPTVFNFFEPAYVQPGPLAAAGLFAPEFQIFTDTTAITVPNYFNTYLTTAKPTNLDSDTVFLDFTDALPLAANPVALVDQMNLSLAGGTLSTAAKTRIVSAITSMPAATSATDKVRGAAYLVMTSPEAAIQQ